MQKKENKTAYLVGKLNYFLTKLKQFWIIILIATVISGAMGGIIARAMYKPEYTVTQSFTISLKEHPNANEASISDNQLSKTLPSLMSSDTFMKYMVKFVREKDANGRFMVSSLSNSNIFNITVVGESNDDCIKILDVFEEHYSDLTEKVIGESEIKIFTEPITSPMPSNAPQYALGIVFGALVAFLICTGILLAKAMISKTIFNATDAEQELNAKCLAEIKEIKIKKRSTDDKKAKNTMPLVSSDEASLELKQSINTLTMNTISKAERNGYKAILVTSTIPGEGKTSVSINLATNLALLGKRTIIVDCDLRSPNIYQHINTKPNTSLTDAIEGKADIISAITKSEIECLDLLGNTESDANASENAVSSELFGIINELKSRYDYVILDTPPVGFLGDGLSLCDAADAFIYVISHNFISTRNVKASLSSFEGSNASMLGFVINHKQ